MQVVQALKLFVKFRAREILILKMEKAFFDISCACNNLLSIDKSFQ